ncbi:hypothetical protein ACIGC1_10450 [Peribacillus butanolivorans]|uniref:hypothetical protein n=1 Tax=Peribacillus butanolivorans TaxID=421767 RepID=UPI0037C7F837
MLKGLFKKKSYKGSKIQLANKKPHDSVLLWNFYVNGFNKKRISLEIGFPLLIALLTIVISVISDASVTEILQRIEKMNGQIADIVAIQIGFNITCLALIASFNRDTLQHTFSKVQEDSKESALKQLLTSFAYCIFVQTGILIFGIAYNTSITDVLNIEFLKSFKQTWKELLIYSFFLLWLAIILHSFMVFLRNVTLIYKFILVVFKKK